MREFSKFAPSTTYPMKKYILVALAALCVQAQAFFTLDFTAYNGTTITPGSPLTIAVAGYGNVTFSVPVDPLTIATGVYVPGSDVTLQMPIGRPVIVSFDGPYAPTDLTNDVFFSFNGLNLSNETLNISIIDSRTLMVTVNGTGNGAGMRNVTFDAIPEPSTTALGALGVLAMALRRRRAC